MCLAAGRQLRFTCLLCLVLLPFSCAYGSEAPSADLHPPSSTSADGAGGKRIPAPPKVQPSHLSLRSRISEHPLVFFPIPDGLPISHGGAAAKFTAGRPGYTLTLGQSNLVLTSHTRVFPAAAPEKKPAADAGSGGSLHPVPPEEVSRSVKVEFVGAEPSATVEGEDGAQGYANFFTGNDPARWRRHVAGFNRVQYKNLYPGIDLIFYGEKQGHLEYDFVVAAGADPQAIKLHISGDEAPRIGEAGELELDGPDGVMRLDQPFLYQTVDRQKKAITGHFVQLAENEFGFRTTGYDKARPLIIDPKISLVYATYAGGIHDDEATDLVLDSSGAAYMTGFTASQDFPVSSNAVQTERANIGTYTYDAFLMKFDASGTLIFSTFLGGSSTDQARAVQLDSAGNVYVAGYTQSSDFPVSSNAYQKSFGGSSDAFLAKLSNDGSQLIYSTYLGGPGGEAINRIKANADGSFWVVGDATADGLPVSSTAFQKKTLSTADGFAAKMQFDTNGNLQIPALTFMGGSNTSGETGLTSDMDVDAAGNLYVTGATQSSDYPVTANAFEKPFPLSGGCYNTPAPNEIVFITKFSPDLSQMLYSTVVGGHTEDQNGYPVCNQYGKTIHVDQATGNIWVVGSTGMSDFPVTSNAISKQLNGNGSAGVDSFVFELSADGTKQLYGTYLGGSQFDYGGAAAWDANNNIWIAGPTQSTDYPVTSNALQPHNAGGFDTFVTELSPDGSKILYATYLGGSGDDDIGSTNRIRIDANGNIHMAGETNSTNYPVTGNASQPVYANGDANPDTADAYYAILGTGAIGTIGPVAGGNTGDTTITVSGAGFEAGATCTLVQGATVLAAINVTINSTGTSMSCTFALNGVVPGSYDVTISNPNGDGTFTKSGAFSVQSGGAPSIWSNILGRPAIRTGVPASFNVTYGNSGNVDAYEIPATVQLPSTFTANLAADSNPFSDDNNYYPDSSGSKYLEFVIPHLAPGQSQSIPVSITDSTGGDTWAIGVTAGNPAFSTLAGAQAGLANSTQGTTCTAASPGGLQNCIALNTSEFVAYVNGVVSDMATEDGFTYDPAQASTVFANYYTAAVKYSISGAIGNSSAVAGPSSGRWSNSATSKPMDGVSIPIGAFTITIGGQQSPVNISFTPTIADAASFGNPVVGAIVGGIVAPLQEVIQEKTTNGGAVCLYAGGGQASVFTGKTKTSCTPCSGGNKQCTDSFQCKGLLSNGQAFYVYVPGTNSYPVACNPNNPKICKTKNSKLRSVQDVLLDLSIPLPRAAAGGSGCGGGSTGGAIDPNYKTGPTGDGSASQYVTGTAALSYAVGFENEPTATLPAAQVVVTDQLDPTKVDLTTLTLGQISFGANTLTLPSGTNIYNTDYKLSSTLNVRVAGSLDSNSGLLKWTFTSIDPSTGQPPTDPTAGFLPPDTNGIVGQGSVLFNIMPKAGQSTGTVITNSASVVFDANAAIKTPTWSNTLDLTPPMSKVTALPALTLPGPFPVSWSGTDTGSGIATYTIYVSDNGGAYTVWLQSVATTSASFTGIVGHTYGFYSLSADAAGNGEAPKTSPDTSTSVVSQLTPLTSTTALSTSSTSVPVGASVTLTALVSPPSGTATIPAGTVTFLNGMATLGMVTLDGTGKAILTTSSLPVGTYSVTASYAGSTSFSNSVSAAVSIVVGTPTVQVSLSPSSLTIPNGSSGTTTVTLASAFGFSSAATLTCSGLPANASCSFAPETVTPAAGGSVTSIMTITTASRSAGITAEPGSRGKGVVFAVFFPLLLACFGKPRRRFFGPNGCRLLIVLAMAGGFLLVSGCGGKGPSAATGTPAGTSAVTITATSATVTQSATLQLTVN